MNRFLFPLVGLLLVSAAAFQIRAARSETLPPASSAVEERRAVPRVVAEGRVSAYPGAEVVVGSDVAGRIETLAVEEQQQVRKGDLIAIVNADDTRAELAEARSRIRELDADIQLFQLESARARQLFAAEVGSRQLWDKAKRDIEVAKAKRTSALAQVERLEALVAKTRIEAPIDGIVIARHADRGESLVEGGHIVTVANLERLRVESEVDEYDTARMHLGAAVRIKAEGYEKSWNGKVEEIPHSVVSRRMNPPDPSKPIDTRVLLVKVTFTEAAPLKLGQRVELEFE